LAFSLVEPAAVQRTLLDLGLRRDDDFETNNSSNFIPAQAGIQRLSSCGSRF
jgi:hypothetical protein